MDQQLNNLECFIIDDGSTDNTKDVVLDYIKDDRRFHYIYQENSGVATARNNGVFLGSAPYVACLDADDAIAPEFLQVCVDALREDPSLGIAYTGLWFIKPDGGEGLSPWPDQYDYDAQLQGRNQIPTCNVARRIVWERLGGQRQRYAPQGAGEEDAEMWLRAGAYGMKARQVTHAGLFIYSWLSGRVSGATDHAVTDYRLWHPWVRDEKHPFGSLASPGRFSHPVRQYDEPAISVIIPVGPGHEEDVVSALDSLDAQTMRNWEAIVVADGAFIAANGNEWSDDKKRLEKSFPHIRFAYTRYGYKASGAGAARNLGAAIAHAPLLLFLDADDWLYPDALEKMLSIFAADQGIVYTDYVGKTYLSEEGAASYGEKLLFYDTSDGHSVVRYNSADYDCERAQRQPEVGQDGYMYVWNLISSLVPTAWHDEIGGFDENMRSWEDWDYWIRMAKAGKCFVRIAEPLLVYRFYTGSRREIGLQEHPDLIQYLKKKYEDIEMARCCGGKTRGGNDKKVLPQPQAQPAQAERSLEMNNDDNFVLVLYDHPNRGGHRVVGQATKTDYGYRAGGEQFYVHKDDVTVQPHIFSMIEEAPPKLETRPVAPPPPPPAPAAPPPPPQPEKEALPFLEPEQPEPEIEPKEAPAGDEPFDLQLVPGINAPVAAQLNAAGVHTLNQLIAVPNEDLVEFKGIGEKTAASIKMFAEKKLAGEV
jgi:glycosyltransferase involved in cell wall biosynthesis